MVGIRFAKQKTLIRVHPWISVFIRVTSCGNGLSLNSARETPMNTGASISFPSLPLFLKSGQRQRAGAITLETEVMHKGFLPPMRDPHLRCADLIDRAVELVPIGVV